MKDSIFYNQESSQYSAKRYPAVVQSYTQFFFTRRLAITLSFLKRVIEEKREQLTLLEVGCADGVIIRAIAEKFAAAFSTMTGIDIAADMIEEARKKNIYPNIGFFTRDTYGDEPRVDCVVETGVINYINFEDELAFAHLRLKNDGLFLFSIAGTDSLRNKLKHESGFADFRSYAVYDRLVRENFTVLSVRGCGVFIPYVWRIPGLARVVHKIVEPIVGILTPNLCHEKVYLVKKK